MRAIFLADGNIFTTGFSRMSERQLALWNPVGSVPSLLGPCQVRSVSSPALQPPTRLVVRFPLLPLVGSSLCYPLLRPRVLLLLRPDVCSVKSENFLGSCF